MFPGKKVVLTLVALALILAACSVCAEIETRQAVGPENLVAYLDGSEWVLASLYDRIAVQDVVVSLEFPERHYLQGYAGCNYYGVRYAGDGGDFDPRGIDKTDFACDASASVLQQEADFFEALGSAVAYRVRSERLQFLDASGRATLEFTLKEVPTISPALEDSEWELVSLKGESLVQGSYITLGFANEGFNGFAGCNGYGGEYAAADQGILTIAEIMHTEKDCPGAEDVMRQENVYLETLGNAAAYRVLDGRLEIDDAAGETMLVLAPKEEFPLDPRDLVGTRWQLLSVDGVSPIEGSTITVAFAENEITGHAGCRDYRVSYQVSDEGVDYVLMEMLGSAELCSEELLLQEGNYTGSLGWASGYRLREGRLEMLTERGEMLIYGPLSETDVQ